VGGAGSEKGKGSMVFRKVGNGGEKEKWGGGPTSQLLLKSKNVCKNVEGRWHQRFVVARIHKPGGHKGGEKLGPKT